MAVRTASIRYDVYPTETVFGTDNYSTVSCQIRIRSVKRIVIQTDDKEYGIQFFVISFENPGFNIILQTVKRKNQIFASCSWIGRPSLNIHIPFQNRSQMNWIALNQARISRLVLNMICFVILSDIVTNRMVAPVRITSQQLHKEICILAIFRSLVEYNIMIFRIIMYYPTHLVETSSYKVVCHPAHLCVSARLSVGLSTPFDGSRDTAGRKIARCIFLHVASHCALNLALNNLKFRGVLILSKLLLLYLLRQTIFYEVSR